MVKKGKASHHKATTTPTAETAPTKLGLARSILGVMATIFVVVFIWVFLPFPSDSAPSKTVRNAWNALKTHDLEGFEEAVNTQAFVKSLIEQVVAFEEINSADHTDRPQSFRQSLNNGILGAFRNDLADTYTLQLNELVQTGSFEKRKDGLLWRLWQQTGAKPAYFKNFEVLDQNDANALLTLNFERTDLGGTMLSLNILVEYAKEIGRWQVTGVPNLANFLLTISAEQKEQLAALNAPIQKKLNEAIHVIDVQKAGGLGDIEKGVLWRVAYRNTSSRNVANFKGTLDIENADGRHLASLDLADTDGLASGQTAERAWPMPLNTHNAAQAELLAASGRMLKTTLTISEVVFTNGDSLKLYAELPPEAAPLTTGNAE